MLESIMLGEIPGTTFRISFYGWLVLVALALLLFLATRIGKRRLPIVRADYFSRKALKLLSQYHLL